jgi:hypothetical protein
MMMVYILVMDSMRRNVNGLCIVGGNTKSQVIGALFVAVRQA